MSDAEYIKKLEKENTQLKKAVSCIEDIIKSFEFKASASVDSNMYIKKGIKISYSSESVQDAINAGIDPMEIILPMIICELEKEFKS